MTAPRGGDQHPLGRPYRLLQLLHGRRIADRLDIAVTTANAWEFQGGGARTFGGLLRLMLLIRSRPEPDRLQASRFGIVRLAAGHIAPFSGARRVTRPRIVANALSCRVLS